MTRRLPYVPEPVNQNDSTSAWFTAREGVLDAVAGLLGPSNYKAHEGVNSGGANGVYWVDVIEERPDGLLVVQNITEGAKRRVDQVKAEIEEAVVFPLLRGREVRRWRAESTASILMVQDPAARRGIDEGVMQRDFPNAHAYLKSFEKPLRARAAFRRYFNRRRNGKTIETGPFYSMFNVGKYTFAPYRVVWHRMIAPIEAVVIGCKKGKPLLPQETHAFVACASQEEAFYLAGMLNSTIFSFTAQAYSQTGGKSFGSPHILENLYVPTFDGEDNSHRETARIATDIQASFDQLDAGELKAKEHQLDMVAARVWDIPDSAVDVVWRSMQELRKADLH